MIANAEAAGILQWQRASESDVCGVALVLHGLNVNPQRMAPLAQALNGLGIETLRLALMGHGANSLPIPGLPAADARLHAFGRVTGGLWLDEVRAEPHSPQKSPLDKPQPLCYAGIYQSATLSNHFGYLVS